MAQDTMHTDVVFEYKEGEGRMEILIRVFKLDINYFKCLETMGAFKINSSLNKILVLFNRLLSW